MSTESRKGQPKVDPLILGKEGETKPLKKHLSQDILASRTHREYMEELNKARREEAKEEGNTSGQTKA
jgi:hypothetical protein